MSEEVTYQDRVGQAHLQQDDREGLRPILGEIDAWQSGQDDLADRRWLDEHRADRHAQDQRHDQGQARP